MYILDEEDSLLRKVLSRDSLWLKYKSDNDNANSYVVIRLYPRIIIRIQRKEACIWLMVSRNQQDVFCSSLIIY